MIFSIGMHLSRRKDHSCTILVICDNVNGCTMIILLGVSVFRFGVPFHTGFFNYPDMCSYSMPCNLMMGGLILFIVAHLNFS